MSYSHLWASLVFQILCLSFLFVCNTAVSWTLVLLYASAKYNNMKSNVTVQLDTFRSDWLVTLWPLENATNTKITRAFLTVRIIVDEDLIFKWLVKTCPIGFLFLVRWKIIILSLTILLFLPHFAHKKDSFALTYLLYKYKVDQDGSNWAINYITALLWDSYIYHLYYSNLIFLWHSRNGT